MSDDFETLVRVVEVFNTIDANLIKGALENSEIFSEIEGEHISDLSITVAGIGHQIFIQVMKKDLETALNVIKNLNVPVKFLHEIG